MRSYSLHNSDVDTIIATLITKKILHHEKQTPSFPSHIYLISALRVFCENITHAISINNSNIYTGIATLFLYTRNTAEPQCIIPYSNNDHTLFLRFVQLLVY